MACLKREHQGKCEHSQCKFPDYSGFQCVEILAGICEAGQDCHKSCPYSFTKKNSVTANLRFMDAAKNRWADNRP